MEACSIKTRFSFESPDPAVFFIIIKISLPQGSALPVWMTVSRCRHTASLPPKGALPQASEKDALSEGLLLESS